MGRLPRRLLASAGLVVALAATTVYAATVPPGGPEVQLASAGAMSVSDSLGGGAILTTSAMAPGRTTTGTVTVTNTGGSPGELALSAGDADANGGRGRALLDALELRVQDTTDGATTEVYAGRLDAITPRALAVLAPGAGRTYRFSATLPDGGMDATGAGDNALQRASAFVAYDWTLTESEAPPVTTTEPETAPVPVPVPEPPTIPTAPDAPAAPAAPAAPVSPIVPGDPALPDAPAVIPSTPLTGRASTKPCQRRILGSARADRLVGTTEGDRIYGRGGADHLSGRAGRDCLYGSTGADVLSGGFAADRLVGGSGDDELTGGPGRDRILAGKGNDEVFARDGERDIVDCGPGRDTVVADRIDVLRRCERRSLRSAPRRRPHAVGHGSKLPKGPTSCRVIHPQSSKSTGRDRRLWWSPVPARCARRTGR